MTRADASGARKLVLAGELKQTLGRLGTTDLFKGEGGKAVSRRRHAAGKKNPWTQAISEAREKLGLHGFVACKRGLVPTCQEAAGGSRGSASRCHPHHEADLAPPQPTMFPAREGGCFRRKTEAHRQRPSQAGPHAKQAWPGSFQGPPRPRPEQLLDKALIKARVLMKAEGFVPCAKESALYILAREIQAEASP